MTKTLMDDDQNRHSIPYTSMDILQTDLDSKAAPDVNRNETIQVSVVSSQAFENDVATKIAYRYLYWACYRSYIYVAHHILTSFRVSPCLSDSGDKRSPFLIAIEHNQLPIIQMILSKTYSYPADPKLITRQMNSTDAYGNNALHKACRFRNPAMIKILLENNISDIRQRNKIGCLPLEQPHNYILNDLRIKNVFREYLNSKNDAEKAELESVIVLRKEPDYMFVVD